MISAVSEQFNRFVTFAEDQRAKGAKTAIATMGDVAAKGDTPHMALTFTLVKDANSGDVKIRYSEPTGFPLHFSWETTVHIDGSSESTNMVVEVPPGMHYKALPGANHSLGKLMVALEIVKRI